MHTLNRIFILTAVLAAMIPLAVGGKLLGESITREDAEERFSDALDEAKDNNRESANLNMSERVNKRIIAETGERLKELEKRKHELRRDIAALLEKIRHAGRKTDAFALVEERSSAQLRRERERAAAFARAVYARAIVADASMEPTRMILRRLGVESLGESVDADLREDAITGARRQIRTSLLGARDTSRLSQNTLFAAAGTFEAQLRELQQEREDVLDEYHRMQRRHETAELNLKLTEEQLAEVQSETAAVEAEIARMQGEMARIDGRLRSQAERELIQMGLREDRPGRYRQGNQSEGFIWPVTGPVTAGFYDSRYRGIFGVPHKGQDIAVSQGTQVQAAADGVVFLARDGGLRGYSYILVGHRDGYATLYGHLSEFSVATGQDIRQGQLIGLSGGRPGTHGAGPMTTGAHLHFEVMLNGAHVDPMTVLQ